MKYTTIKIDAKVAARVKKYVKKNGLTIGFYVSAKIDHALKVDTMNNVMQENTVSYNQPQGQV